MTSPKFYAVIPEQKHCKMPCVLGLVPDTEFISLEKVFRVHFWVAFSLKRTARPLKPLD